MPKRAVLFLTQKFSTVAAGAGAARRNPESKGAIMDEKGPPCAVGSGKAKHDSESEGTVIGKDVSNGSPSMHAARG